MNLIYAALAFLLALFLVLAGVTRVGCVADRAAQPAGRQLRRHQWRAPALRPCAGARHADLPPIVFIHGASANLNDQMVPLRPLLEGRAEMLFFDRPGHGWSERGPGNDEPRAARQRRSPP